MFRSIWDSNTAPPSVAGLHTLHAAAVRCQRPHGQDWFTKYALAEALHIRAQEVQKWIDRGQLKCRIVETGRLKKEIIDAADFCDFCKHHRAEIVGRRLNSDRLSFVQMFVFPPGHMELLPVREAKEEQAEYEAQMKKEDSSVSPEFEPEDDLGLTAQY